MSDNKKTDSKEPKQKNAALTVDEARAAILKIIPTTSRTVTVPLEQSVGRISASDVHAIHDIPPFRNSAMDGYAVLHSDITGKQPVQVVGTSLAGHPYTQALSSGEAVRITTGAATPDNTDAIVIQEQAEINGSSLTTNDPVKLNQYIRNPGDDIRRGQLLLSAKTKINAADTGLLAAQGLSEAHVFDQPRVGVFSTGDELRGPNAKLEKGQIFDANRTTIRSLLKNAGINSTDLGICRDDPADIEQMMKSASQFDFVLSSGGVSVGEADYVKQTLEKNGELFFWKVAMKPGKPLVTGKLNNGAIYFGLPGNPVSSMVTCLQFVIPAIAAFSGCDYQAPPTLRAKCLSTLKKAPGRFEFQRGKVNVTKDGELQVSTTGLQDSHVLSSMSQANCFICLDQHASGAEIGEDVSVILFTAYTGM